MAKLSNKKSIGELAIINVPIFDPDAKISYIKSKLFDKTNKFYSSEYIYAVKGKKLYGVVKFKELISTTDDNILKKIVKKGDDLVVAKETSHGNEISNLAIKHKLSQIPIVNKHEIFLGVIPSHTILRITKSEALEDLLHLGGVNKTVGYDDVFEDTLKVSLKHRLPWLLIGLVGGLISAELISSFETTLSANLILASFIPLIVYMADAVGTQMEAFIIRDLAYQPKLKFSSYLLKQLSIVAFISIIIAIALFFLSLFLYKSPNISIVLAVSLVISVISSVFTGLIIPYLFKKFKYDPADASGPIATVIQDTLSIIIYFSVASLMLN